MIEILTDDMLPLEGGCVMSLGNFDGVHIGHAQLIKELAAAKNSEKAVVFTFAQHPLNLISDKKPVKYIIGSSDKMKYLGELGADAVYFADFAEMKDYSPERFVDEVLIKLFNPKTVVCGDSFTFGQGKSGNAELLSEMLRERGVSCIVVPPVKVRGRVVSSTLIRSLITEGKLEEAEELLGRKYSIILPVIHGRAYGRTIGVPTINQLFPPDRIVPKFGVYACLCEIDGILYEGVANVGVRPTIAEPTPEPLCETHIFEFSERLYDRDVRVIFCSLIREEEKYGSLEELISQIMKDIEDCKKYFANSSKG
ncbi:MAG: bifunctional riboflavin kinase/FAD synthetase [Eubacteriales bacterium]|nr:bifunctional riboflavin kinase/FAD synthetase [Eubacteriales bacterium]MDD4474786.1 bifunctional riboflavin kinase/FAD synthetase [Eubacteriales bacterium]